MRIKTIPIVQVKERFLAEWGEPYLLKLLRLIDV